jgi:hypothetical protein
VRALALLVLVGAPPGVLAGPSGRRRRRTDRARADLATARGLGEQRELVGRLVDRLQVALVLVLAARGSDVRMPALGHPATSELDAALIKGRLELEQQERSFNVQDPRHTAKER